MKRKALLVGARASFEGPWVHLERGEWVVDPTFSSEKAVELEIKGAERKVEVSEDNKWLRVIGPCQIRATVLDSYEGPGLHLDVELVAHA